MRGSLTLSPRRREGRGRGSLIALVAFILGFAAAPATVSAQTLDEVVAGVEATYGRVNDLKAEFSQVSHNKSLGQDIKAEGTVYLKKGGKLRWDYKTPSPQQIVSDGVNFWVYTPELNQVNKGEAPKALAGAATRAAPSARARKARRLIARAWPGTRGPRGSRAAWPPAPAR